jgi:undecaprenyl diphosphate synthase
VGIAKMEVPEGISSEREEPALAGAGLPRHVAIIMDGNGRWATAHGLPRFEGHRRGVAAVRRAGRTAAALGLEALTLYSFSSENWSRPAAEVGELMTLLKLFVRSDLKKLHADNVRVRVIGEGHPTDSEIQGLFHEAEALTHDNTGLTLSVAFNYGARGEITRAARELAREVLAGRLSADDITPERLEERLDTAGLPPLDLVIRTSGEERLSNFLLWQAAYAELVFLPVLWPDFDRSWFERALAVFARRERRFGGVDTAGL